MHNFSCMVNANQSLEERRLKYWVCRQYCGSDVKTARRLRGWNWQPMTGALTTNAWLQGKPKEFIDGIRDICQHGYDMFKAEHYANGR